MLQTFSLPTGWPDLRNVPALTDSLRREVIAVRTAVYDANHLSNVSPDDEFDDAPNTVSFLLRERGHSVGTVRVSVRQLNDPVDSTPCSRVFGAELAKSFRLASFVEMSRLAILPRGPGDSTKRYLAAMQNGIAAADGHDCRYVLAPTRTGHSRIYFGMGFFEVAPARAYLHTTCCLLALDLPRHRHSLQAHARFGALFANRNCPAA